MKKHEGLHGCLHVSLVFWGRNASPADISQEHHGSIFSFRFCLVTGIRKSSSLERLCKYFKCLQPEEFISPKLVCMIPTLNNIVFKRTI